MTQAPLTDEELKHEQGTVVIRAAVATLVCIAVLGASALFLPRVGAFPTDLAERLAFALQADLFVFVWLLIGAQMVSSGRFHSAADNQGSAFAPPSSKIAVRVAFLQNTLEQAVMAAGAHLALASLTSGPALALIPAAVALFALGRITFLIGYPKGAGGRAFGMVATAFPTILGYGFAMGLLLERAASRLFTQ